MSRTQEQGIDYFPFAVDFFSDNTIRILKARYGTDGIAICVFLFCMIYREGFYIKADNDLPYIISAELNISVGTVQQVMTFLTERSLLTSILLDPDTILTSDGIQSRWQRAIASRAAKTPIEVDSRIWLLAEKDTRPFVKVVQISDSSTKKDLSSTKKAEKSEKNEAKKSKVKTTTTLYINNERKSDKKENVEDVEDVENCVRPGIEPPSLAECYIYFRDELCEDNAAAESSKFHAYNAARGWDCLPLWKEAADLWQSRKENGKL